MTVQSKTKQRNWTHTSRLEELPNMSALFRFAMFSEHMTRLLEKCLLDTQDQSGDICPWCAASLLEKTKRNISAETPRAIRHDVGGLMDILHSVRWTPHYIKVTKVASLWHLKLAQIGSWTKKHSQSSPIKVQKLTWLKGCSRTLRAHKRIHTNLNELK